jgi:hypothetical protein
LPFLRLILQGGELNVVENASIEILGGVIHTEPEMQGNKEVTISLANAVAKENNRGSVTAAQKAGRKAKNKASPPKTRAATRAKAKGKGRAIEEVGEIASEVLGGNRNRKRKAVDIDAGTGPSELVSEPRKLRKRA